MVKKSSFVGQKSSVVMSILLLSLLLHPLSSYALKVGDKAPDFHVITLEGREMVYDKDIKGTKPVYLFFWTTW